MKTFDPSYLTKYDFDIMAKEAEKNGNDCFAINENQIVSTAGFLDNSKPYVIPSSVGKKTLFLLLDVLKENNIDNVMISIGKE